MAATTKTALDLITDAYAEINSVEAGETLNAADSAYGLQKLNDLLESWTIEKLFVFSSTENRFIINPGQYQYTIGNPVGGNFTGTLVSGSNVISNVTVPSTLVVGSMITDVQAAIPTATPTQVTSFNAGANTVTLSANATFTVSTAEVFTFTTPGNIAYDSTTGASISLPVRITNAFTRITSTGSLGLDYPIEVINRDKYFAIGLKGIAGPWAKSLYYNRTFPLGNIYLYPNPSTGGELHYITDTILQDLTSINSPVNLTQGYARAIKTNLAIELAAANGKAVAPSLAMRAKQSKAVVKSLNAIPEIEAFFDKNILNTRRADAGFIMDGGFRT